MSMQDEEKTQQPVIGNWLDDEYDDDDDDDQEIGTSQPTRQAEPESEPQQKESFEVQQEQSQAHEPRGERNDDQAYGAPYKRDNNRRDNQNRGYNKNRNFNDRDNRGGDRQDRGEGKGRYNKRAEDFGGDRPQAGYQQRERREPRAPQEQINENSNYRLYYCNDPQFFIKVIDKEEAPFEFKIHMFSKTGPPEASEEKEEQTPMRNQDELHMLMELDNYDAKEIRTHVVPWQPREQETRGKQIEPKDKTRFTFFINEKEQALQCFKDFQAKPQTRDSRIYSKIFYLKPESTFERFADEAADEFYKEENSKKEERAAQKDKEQKKKDEIRQKKQDQLALKKRLSNDPVSSQERQKIEKETAISFGSKPVFKNSHVKKEVEEKKAEVPTEQANMADGVRSSYVQPQRKVFDTTRGRGERAVRGNNERGGRGGRGGRNQNEQQEEGIFYGAEKPQQQNRENKRGGFQRQEGRGRGDSFRTEVRGRGEQRGGRGRGRGQAEQKYEEKIEVQQDQVQEKEMKEDVKQEEGEKPKKERVGDYGVEVSGGDNRPKRNNRQKQRPFTAKGGEGADQTSGPQQQPNAAEGGENQTNEGAVYQKRQRPRRNEGEVGKGRGNRPYTGAGGTGESNEGETQQQNNQRGRGRGRGQQAAAEDGEGNKQKQLIYRRVNKDQEAKPEGAKQFTKISLTKQPSTQPVAAPAQAKQQSNVAGKGKGAIGSFANKFAGM